MSHQQLTVMSLNVGRFLQPRTGEYLRHLIKSDQPPDVLCLQDVPVRELSWLMEKYPHVAFAPMTRHSIWGEPAVVGIAVVTGPDHPVTNIVHCTTWGNGVLKNLQGINDKNQRHLGEESDRLVEMTEDRVVICCSIMGNDDVFDVATTHGMWVRDGVTNDRQRENTVRLLDFINKEGKCREGLVLVGDMNFGRGGEIYNMCVVERLTDCMPENIESTLDPDHPAAKKGIKVVTDWFFTYEGRPDMNYEVSDVKLVPGVSDHCALTATIRKAYV